MVNTMNRLMFPELTKESGSRESVISNLVLSWHAPNHTGVLHEMWNPSNFSRVPDPGRRRLLRLPGVT